MDGRSTAASSELYNFLLTTKPNILQENQENKESPDDLQVPWEDVEQLIRTLEGGRSPGVDRGTVQQSSG